VVAEVLVAEGAQVEAGAALIVLERRRTRHDPAAPCAAIAVDADAVAAARAGVEFEVVEWPFDRTLRSPEYLALNPAGRVPALELDGRTIWETGAITEVLCERFPETGMGRAPGDPERIDWLIWVHFAETLSQHIATLTQQHIVLYGGSHALAHPDEDRGQAGREMLRGDRRAAGGAGPPARHRVLGGGCQRGAGRLHGAPFRADEPFPDLQAAGMTGLPARPGFIASLPVEDDDRLYTRDYYEPWEVT
jgi:glutathione S-transferase